MRLADLAGLGRSAGLALMACMAAPQAVQAQAARPNILFILANNLGYGELGAYGGGATPRLDRLAAEGLRLTNMNMEAQCTSSRSSILTGRFAIRSGTHSVPFGGVADGLTQPHLPTLPNPDFAGRTGHGDWADMLAEMDHNVGQMLDAVDRLDIRDDTVVIFASDNRPEFVKPWDGWAGPWRGQYFTAWEGGIRVPFMVRWPGKIPAGRVSDEIVHGVDIFPTLAALTGAGLPQDRPIDGVDQSGFFLGGTERSAREAIPMWCADRLQAVKWRNFKVHFYEQETMVSPRSSSGSRFCSTFTPTLARKRKRSPPTAGSSARC